MLNLFVFVMLAITNSLAYAHQRCDLVNQTDERPYNPNQKQLICDYVCEDGSSRIRYASGYCPAAIGSN